MKIIKYDKQYEKEWNNYLKNTKNGHFFFNRGYLEYHSDRFNDYSLLFFNDKNKIIALLPANLKDNILYSHQGLTFGGFLVDDRIKTEVMLEIFNQLVIFLKEQQITKIIYKCIPYIYHIKPAEEDRYALFINNAKLIRRDVTSTIDLAQDIKYTKGRKWSVNKAKKENITVEESRDCALFWNILTNVLKSNHKASPVHNINEITHLMEMFNTNIRLFLAKKDQEVLSGALIFENESVVHTQYLANTDVGRDTGALDFLLDHLIKVVYKDKKYFDFGISNENSGRYLNTGLIAQKEGFGARAIAHDFYELDVL